MGFPNYLSHEDDVDEFLDDNDDRHEGEYKYFLVKALLLLLSMLIFGICRDECVAGWSAGWRTCLWPKGRDERIEMDMPV